MRDTSDTRLLIVRGKNHILLVKNIKIPSIFTPAEFPIVDTTPIRITVKMASLNQKGKKINGNFLNIPQEICIPPKIAKGSNIDVPASI